jgi:hypothetical protein
VSETLTMTRGELADLLSRAAMENPKYREALIKDPKMVPHVANEGELSDSELENVAGGHATYNIATAQCS